MSPEAELLTMGTMVDSQNALYNLFRIGLSSYSGGVGACFALGTFRQCGYTSSPYTYGYLDYTPDAADSASVVSQLATILTADRISSTNRALIEAAYDANYDQLNPHFALQVAQVLLASTPEYHTTNQLVGGLSSNERAPTPPGTTHVAEDPYKAIVHVNLFGGVDSMNLLAPHPDGCQALYDEYTNTRGTDLSLTTGEMVKIDVGAGSDEQPCTSFGVNSAVSKLADIYNAGDAIFFVNTGHLQKPVDRYNFEAETTAQLFSHHSMKDELFKVDAFRERDETGVLGRMQDILGNNRAARKIAIGKAMNNLGK